MNNIDELTKEFLMRIWDDIQLWRLRRQYARITEDLRHLMVTRKEIKRKIQNIEAYYEVE